MAEARVAARTAEPKAPAVPAVVRHVYQDGAGNDVTRYGLRVGRDQVVWLGVAEPAGHLDLED
jgi:hypothetical protein